MLGLKKVYGGAAAAKKLTDAPRAGCEAYLRGTA